MRALIALLLALPLTAGGLEQDKQLHIAGGLLIGAGASWVAERNGSRHPVLWGIAIGSAVGIAKELYDRKHPDKHTADVMDAAATSGGAMCGAVIQFKIRF